MSRSPSLVPDNHAFDALASMLDCCQTTTEATAGLLTERNCHADSET